MYLKKIAFSVFLLCAFAATVTAQNQTIEQGSADELKGVEKIFVDARADMSVRDKIIEEIRKSLRAVKRELIIVSKPENATIVVGAGFPRPDTAITDAGGENPPLRCCCI